MLLDQLEQAIAAVDRLDWRFVQDADGYWYAYFHPDWQADPVRVVLADEEPSKNEIAAIAALQLMMEHAPKLVQVAKAAQAMYDALNDSRLSEPRPLEEHQARSGLRAALAELG
jgi:hypothetical protein